MSISRCGARFFVSFVLVSFGEVVSAQERSAPIDATPSIRAAIDRSFQQGGDHAPSQSASTHRFFDRTNVTLTFVEIGVMVVDGITTERGLRKYPTSREANPLARPFVNAGWPGQIAGGAGRYPPMSGFAICCTERIIIASSDGFHSS